MRGCAALCRWLCHKIFTPKEKSSLRDPDTLAPRYFGTDELIFSPKTILPSKLNLHYLDLIEIFPIMRNIWWYIHENLHFPQGAFYSKYSTFDSNSIPDIKWKSNQSSTRTVCWCSVRSDHYHIHNHFMNYNHPIFIKIGLKNLLVFQVKCMSITAAWLSL